MHEVQCRYVSSRFWWHWLKHSMRSTLHMLWMTMISCSFADSFKLLLFCYQRCSLQQHTSWVNYDSLFGLDVSLLSAAASFFTNISLVCFFVTESAEDETVTHSLTASNPDLYWFSLFPRHTEEARLIVSDTPPSPRSTLFTPPINPHHTSLTETNTQMLWPLLHLL